MRVPRSYHVRMQPSPVQAAEHEQAQRQAAFQRARAKLAAARGADEQQRSYDSMFNRALGIALLAVIVFGVIGLVVWAKPEALDPATWKSDPILPAVLGIILLATVAGIVFRRLKKPPSPAEIAVRDFYETASGDTSDADNFSRHVIQADLDDAARRAPAFENGIIRPERLDSPDALKRYWRCMFRPGFMLRYESKVKGVSLTPLADDLMLAHVKLRVARYSWGLAGLVFMAFIVLTIVLVGHAEGTQLEIPAGALLMGGAIVAAQVLPLRNLETYTVRKLLVRCGEQWRLFCGDWEGWEEADLSWLDEPSE
jgi:hypothetical protein